MTSSAAADWNFVCGSRSMVTTSECVMWTGVMAGAVLFGSFSDKFGRANAVNLAVCVNIIGGILVSISPYSPVFLITLFCQGSTLSGLLMSSFVLAVEHIGNECHLLASDIVFVMYPFVPPAQYGVKRIMKMTVFLSSKFICFHF